MKYKIESTAELKLDAAIERSAVVPSTATIVVLRDADNGNMVGTVIDPHAIGKAHAIVRAVNQHDHLIGLLKCVGRMMDGLRVDDDWKGVLKQIQITIDDEKESL